MKTVWVTHFTDDYSGHEFIDKVFTKEENAKKHTEGKENWGYIERVVESNSSSFMNEKSGKEYMLSELIQNAVTVLTEKGDMPVVIDVLTENQSNLFSMCHGLDVYQDKCYITLDLSDMSIANFKKSIR